MNGLRGTKHGLKKLGSWVPAILHAQVKASSAMHGQTMEEWIEEAAREKLERERRKVSA